MDEKQEFGINDGFVDAIRDAVGKRRKEPWLLLFDAISFAVGFMLSRLHLVFGSYPLALAFVSASPVGVWQAALGATLGSALLEGGGIIRAILVLISLFIRVLISANSQSGASPSFDEPVILRIASAVIASFVGSVYSVIVDGVVFTAFFSGFATTLLSAVFTFVFSLLYNSDVRFSELVFAETAVVRKERTGKAKRDFVLFEASLYTLILLLSVSLKELSLLGIDASYVFASLVTLFFAKRFGAVRGAIVGFLSSVGISAVYSVAFALFGLCSGLIFPFGAAYAIIAGAVSASIFSAYSGGVVGFLSVVPEIAVSSTAFFPFAKAFFSENDGAREAELSRLSLDMVEAAAVRHKLDLGLESERIKEATLDIASLVRAFAKREGSLSERELRERLLYALRDSCSVCPHYDICKAISPAPCLEIIGDLASAACKAEGIFDGIKDILPGYCQNKDGLFEALSCEIGIYFKEMERSGGLLDFSETCELIIKMICEARVAEEREGECDAELSEKLSKLFSEGGVGSPSARLIGSRRKRIIAAGCDVSGGNISSPELKAAIAELIGADVSSPEFTRRGDIALFDAGVLNKFSFKYAKRSVPANQGEGSGDTLLSFVSPDGYFYSIIADGMGTGKEAGELSRLSSELLSKMLSASISDNTALHVLNRIIRRKKDERSVALDIFKYDLQSGEGVFVKSGAAVSYVKRGASLFRVRSETAPLGLMQKIDSERVRIEARVGDFVIMMSDGVADTDEAGIFNAISRGGGSADELALEIIEEARRNGGRDDMSVAVIELTEAS